MPGIGIRLYDSLIAPSRLPDACETFWKLEAATSFEEAATIPDGIPHLRANVRSFQDFNRHASEDARLDGALRRKKAP